jgi:hypothetical protein
MPKKQQQLVILGVLALVMAAVYARALRPAPPSRVPSALSAAAAASAAPPAVPNEPAGTISLELPAESGPRRAQREHAATLAWGRDPFTGGSAGGEVSGFDLSGILWDPSQPIAIINGQMLRVGEELEGYRVLAITQDTVSLSDGGQPLNLTIPQ